MWIKFLKVMAFHNTYNKKNVVEEYKKRFQQILEYTSFNGSDLQEADDEMPSDENREMENGNMEQMPNMSGDNNNSMGETPDISDNGFDYMEQSPNDTNSNMDTMEQDPNTTGTDLTSGFNPQGVEGNLDGMGNEMSTDTMQDGDEVVDVTELTDAQEETQEDIEKFDEKFVKAIKAIKNIETLINKNNEDINSKIAEIENEMKKRNPTPMEKLSNRAANSYPFNITPEDYWNEKEKNSNYSTENDNNGVGQEQYTITGADINGATDWKNISDTLSDDILYNQTLNNILRL